MTTNHMISLYDHLGHAAGHELGKKIASRAMNQGIEISERNVNTATYTGKILKYPEWWLNKQKDLL